MKNWFLFLAFVGLSIAPLIYFRGETKAEFGGADGQAEQAIAEIRKGYQPWVVPIWEPPSGEIESTLFALQASLGTGVLAFGFGWWAGKRRNAGGGKVVL